MKGEIVGDWKITKENTIVVEYKNMKTKQVISGFKDNAVWSRKWYPVFANGDYIKELHATVTKEEMKSQLEQYILNLKS